MSTMSIIMPFLNERDEPLRTVQSIYETCDPSRIEILAIDDGSEMAPPDFSAYPAVRYFRNEQRTGLHHCVEQAVAHAQHPNLMRIDAHMRFRNDNWLDRIIEALDREPNSILCTTSVALDPQHTDVYQSTKKYYGANIILENPEERGSWNALQILEPKWAQPKPENEYSIHCILGANYGFKKDWFNYLRGVKGLHRWGGNEVFMSLKTWMAGGRVKILKDVEIGHIYRNEAPYVTMRYHLFYNKMFMCWTLFPDELSYKLVPMLGQDPAIDEAQKIIHQNWSDILETRAYFQSIFKRSIFSVCEELGIVMP